MRTFRAIPILVASLLVGFCASGAGAHTLQPISSADTVHPQWHRVAGDVDSAVGNGPEFVINPTFGEPSLLNIQTGTRVALSPCENANEYFGGLDKASVAFTCIAGDGSRQVDLYDISTATWTEQPLDPSICETGTGDCEVSAVGADWIRVYVANVDSPYASGSYFLQNIQTGAVQTEPAGLYNDIEDDLASATGTGTPCSTSTAGFSHVYGSLVTGDLEPWTQQGRFLLKEGESYDDSERPNTPDQLLKCGTKVRFTLPLDTVIGAGAVVAQQDRNNGGTAETSLNGRYLPTLKPFYVPNPKGTLIAVQNRVLYTIASGSLWAGALPR